MANSNADKLIVVTGATGHQGGAVARHLLQKGFSVRAITRDPKKREAQELEGQGAEIVRADLDDAESIDAALEEAYGVFAVQNFWETGYEREIAQGKRVADAADTAEIQHFVYSSVGSANRNTGLPHFESKWMIEEHIRNLDLPYTILRPVFFMQNWKTYCGEAILNGKLMQPLDPDVPLQQVDVNDIGAFAAMAFENPRKWLARELEIAGDELTMPETAAVFSRVMGRHVEYIQAPWDEFRKATSEETTMMYRWFNDVGYEADIIGLRQEYPQLAALETFLRTQEWAREKAAAR